MKKTLANAIARFPVVAISSLLVLTACQDDKEILPSAIEFGMDHQNVTEGNETYVRLTFDRPASENGTVELAIETNAIYNEHYETDHPFRNSTVILNIYKGQESARLKVTAINNVKYEGARFIIFQLKNPTEEFRLGSGIILTLTIDDDESPSVANFEVNSAALSEKDGNGIIVNIPFSAPAKGEGSVKVVLNAGQAVNGINFTINPQLDQNSFVLNVLRNATSVSFTVFPVDNELFTGNFILSFSIDDISGVMQKGDNVEYSLTLADDEAPSIAKFALTSGSVNEAHSNGIVVDILLSSPVKGAGEVVIALSSGNAVYGTDFTTLPEVKDNTLAITLSHGQNSASFTVFPIDNDLPTGNITRSFSISGASGVVWKGSNNLSYQLTIADDD